MKKPVGIALVAAALIVAGGWWLLKDEPAPVPDAPPPPPPAEIRAVRGVPCHVEVTVRGGAVSRARLFSARAQLDVPAVVAADGRSFEGELPEQGQIFIAAETADGRNAARSVMCGGSGEVRVFLDLPKRDPNAATLDGRCVYLDTGAPVAGAVVRGRYEAGVGSNLVSALADDDGRFRLALPAGVYAFRCAKDADEGAPVRVSLDPASTREVNLFVEARAGVSTIVVDADGQPVGDVVVRGRVARAVLSRDDEIQERTDDEGRALLMGFAPGPVTIEVQDNGRFAEAHAVAKVELPYAEARLKLVDSPVRLEGEVTDANGVPVDGASVEATALDNRGAASIAPLSRTTTTDPDGHFVIGGLLSGKHAIRAHKPEYAAATLEMNLPVGISRASLRLLAACTAEIEVLPKTPQQPVRVSLRREDGASWVVAGLTGERLQVPDASGTAQLFARTTGASVRTATATAPLCGGVVRLQLAGDESRGAIAVVVRDRDGETVEGADVWVDAPGGRARTGPKGEARFDGLEPRRYQVGTLDALEPSIVEVLPGGVADVELIVDRKRGAIRGKVVSNGAPVEGARVLASCGDTGRAGALADASVMARSDESGAFEILPKEGGVCVVRAEHPSAGRSRAVTLQAGGDPAIIELDRGASIAGRVIATEDGSAVSPYTLVIQTQGSAAEAETRTQYVADPSGAFLVEDVAPGRVTLRVTGEAGRGYVEVDVVEGDRKTGVDVRVFTRGPVTGRVVGRDKKPVAGARVSINGDGRDLGRMGTGPDGRFSTIVPAGEPVRAYVSAEGFYPKGTPPVTLVPGGTTDIGDIELEPRGGPEEKQAGIGIMITQDPRGIRIIRFVDDSPAREAGLEIGDLIVAIDGVPPGRQPLMNWVVSLRGPVGTPVSLEVERGTSPPFIVTIIRREVGLRALPNSIP